MEVRGYGEVFRLKRLFEHSSPVIMIQTVYRGYRERKIYKRIIHQAKEAAKRIQKIVRGYLLRKRNMTELKQLEQELGTPSLTSVGLGKERNPFILYYCFLKCFYLLHKIRTRIKNKSILKLQKVIKGRIARSHSYVRALEIEKYPRMYITNLAEFK